MSGIPQDKLVSIIMPCYNKERYISEAIQSCLAQTYKNIEIIIVNDGSTDNSLSLINKFSSPVIKILNQEHRGVSVARNHALSQIQGDYIQYLDADDLLAPDKIEQQVQILSGSGPYIIAVGKWKMFYNNLKNSVFSRGQISQDMDPVGCLIYLWDDGRMVAPNSWLLSRGVSDLAGPWDEALVRNNDGEYFSRAILASKGIKFSSSAVSYYRRGVVSSLSTTNSPVSINSLYRSLELCMNNLLSKENSPRTRHACAMNFYRFAYIYTDFQNLAENAKSKVRQLIGSDLKPRGGFLFNVLSYVLGWKKAEACRRFIYRCGYRKIVLESRLYKLMHRIYRQSKL